MGKKMKRHVKLMRERDMTKSERKFRDLVNKMTNHQRNLWARAGYKGLRQKDPKQLKPFVAERPTA